MKYTALLLLPLFIFTYSCGNDEETPNNQMQITGVTVIESNRAGYAFDEAYIDHPKAKISLLCKDRIVSDSMPFICVLSINLTEGASSIPVSGSSLQFDSIDDFQTITVTGSDGTSTVYNVFLRDNQLPNADLTDWYLTPGSDNRPYLECGLSASSTIWATANFGTSAYRIYGTLPDTINGNNVRAKITTGGNSFMPILAGTLFTGTFDINGAIEHPTDPTQATDFGIPYTLRPVAIKFNYSYVPGTHLILSTLKNPSNIWGGFNVDTLDGEDMFAAYAYLEIRNGDTKTEIARAELELGVEQANMTSLTLPFEYTSNEHPTHISVVFSSSKEGAIFKGAVGSTLIVDDIELIYE
jgi:hypothetical protein